VKWILCGVLWLAGDGTSGRSGQSAKIFQIPEIPLSVQSATATITRAVTAADGVYAPGHLGGLTPYLPFELVDDVLEQTRTVQRRLRALPSRTGVYFLLGLAMFPRLGYARVWAKLTAGLAGWMCRPRLRRLPFAHRGERPGAPTTAQSAHDRRAINGPLARATRGQSGSVRTATNAWSASAAPVTVALPKLIVRVRFSSPAPRIQAQVRERVSGLDLVIPGS
jgi:Insertion element 4 transposase N-terminal